MRREDARQVSERKVPATTPKLRKETTKRGAASATVQEKEKKEEGEGEGEEALEEDREEEEQEKEGGGHSILLAACSTRPYQ